MTNRFDSTIIKIISACLPNETFSINVNAEAPLHTKHIARLAGWTWCNKVGFIHAIKLRANLVSSTEDILIQAYCNAKECFRKQLSTSEYDKIFAVKNAGIQDVQEALSLAKATYEGRKGTQSRPFKWLSLFSSRVMYYGKVLDVVG